MITDSHDLKDSWMIRNSHSLHLSCKNCKPFASWATSKPLRTWYSWTLDGLLTNPSILGSLDTYQTHKDPHMSFHFLCFARLEPWVSSSFCKLKWQQIWYRICTSCLQVHNSSCLSGVYALDSFLMQRTGRRSVGVKIGSRTKWAKFQVSSDF